jgi:hypothetical protein
MTSNDPKQSERRQSARMQRLDREIRDILARIEKEPVPQNLTKLAEELQAALQRKRGASDGD